MSTSVFLVILVAALLHASWNAVVKSSRDTSLDIVAVTGSAGLISAVALPFLAPPLPASWPFIAASAVVHVAYFSLIAASYRTGDMSVAYPLMRGVPPLLVALASGPLIGQRLARGEWLGIVLICAGIFGLLLVSGRGTALGSRATAYALLNAFVIATYTTIDGTGVRVSGSPAAYVLWLFFSTAPLLAIGPVLRRRADVARHLRARWPITAAGGAVTLAAYILVLWAMTQAPIAIVEALRETSIVFGVAISALVLKERLGWLRPVAAAVVLAGVATIKLV